MPNHWMYPWNTTRQHIWHGVTNTNVIKLEPSMRGRFAPSYNSVVGVIHREASEKRVTKAVFSPRNVGSFVTPLQYTKKIKNFPNWFFHHTVQNRDHQRGVTRRQTRCSKLDKKHKNNNKQYQKHWTLSVSSASFDAIKYLRNPKMYLGHIDGLARQERRATVASYSSRYCSYCWRDGSMGWTYFDLLQLPAWVSNSGCCTENRPSPDSRTGKNPFPLTLLAGKKEGLKMQLRSGSLPESVEEISGLCNQPGWGQCSLMYAVSFSHWEENLSWCYENLEVSNPALPSRNTILFLS